MTIYLKTIFILVIFIFANTVTFANEEVNKKDKPIKNIWLKTYKNYKNYNSILNNIYKIEQEIAKNQKNQKKIQEYTNKLSIYKSKLSLYEKNKNFNDLLKDYKYEIIDITIYDYLFNISLSELKKKINRNINDFVYIIF